MATRTEITEPLCGILVESFEKGNAACRDPSASNSI